MWSSSKRMTDKERIFSNAMLSTNMPWNSLRLDFVSAMRSLREGHTRSHEEIDFTFKRSVNMKESYVSKIYAVYLFLCEIPSQLMHFCHCCRSLKRVACDRTAFQQFIMMDSFLDCFIGCIVLDLHQIIYEPEEMVVKWSQV